MRTIIFHRRAARYLRRMPRDRAAQVRDALLEVSNLTDISLHPNIKPMKGDMVGCRVSVWEATELSCNLQ